MIVKLSSKGNRYISLQQRQGYMPKCVWLGVVTNDNGLSGALMQNQDGDYVQLLNARGIYNKLDSTEVQLAMLEAQQRPLTLGRPLSEHGRMIPIQVMLPMALIERCKQAGNGNLSLGLRTLLSASNAKQIVTT